MIAVDTNVVVRLLIEDDPEQTDRAKRLLESERVFLPLTVALESWWVLRNVYRHGRKETTAALKAFVAMPGVEPENPDRLATAIGWAEAGMDFADALHLAAMPEGEGFATYDADLIRLARQAGLRAFAP